MAGRGCDMKNKSIMFWHHFYYVIMINQ